MSTSAKTQDEITRMHGWLPMRRAGLWALAAAIVLWGLPAGHALAAASVCTTSSSTTITMPALTIPPNTANGTLLGSPVSINVVFSCNNIPSGNPGNNLYIQAGSLAPREAADPPTGGILFDTSMPGIAFKLTASPDQASSSACLRCGPNSEPGFEIGRVVRQNGGVGTFTETFTGQFMKTGAVTSGTVSQINLMQFSWYEFGTSASSGPMAQILRLASVQIAPTTCAVTAGSQNLAVTLPTVSTKAMASNGATAGRTRFNLNYTCQTGANASISLDTTSPSAVATGLVAPTTGAGYAANVGVQVLDRNFAPVAFTSVQSQGATPNGTLSIPFYAQYYRINTPGSGQVKAVVTFTLTYQ
ncbi:MAG TPA: fimbrial protein [Lysobacter sp.]